MKKSETAYDVVLSDLKTRRAELSAEYDQVSQAIAAIENLFPKLQNKWIDFKGPNWSSIKANTANNQKVFVQVYDNDFEVESNMFVGKTISDSVKILLEMADKPLQTSEITKYLIDGGVNFVSSKPNNTVFTSLTRRQETVGDVVKTGRGYWGLSKKAVKNNQVKAFASGSLGSEAAKSLHAAASGSFDSMVTKAVLDAASGNFNDAITKAIKDAGIGNIDSVTYHSMNAKNEFGSVNKKELFPSDAVTHAERTKRLLG